MEEANYKFKCPVCNMPCAGGVQHSQVTDEGYLRRRECEYCGERFVTLETVIRVVRKRKDRKSKEARK